MGTRINERGNTVEHSFAPGDRYHFDLKRCRAEDGWLQFDTGQDAWYFGVWVNKTLRQTITYCEGDVFVVTRPADESFNAEIQYACEFYEEGFVAKTIDGTGTITTHRQDRAEFFILEDTP